MKNVNNILCVIDPTSDVQPALDRAAWFAQHTGAALELLMCVCDDFGGGPYLFLSLSASAQTHTDILERYENHLANLAGPLRDAGITVTTKVVWDRPLYEGIVRHAISSNADIVFKDTHHRSAIERTFLTNSDWNLIRTCPAPLWLVKPRDWHQTPVVIAAIDPNHRYDKPAVLDDCILGMGGELAKSTGAELHAFHSYDPRSALAYATEDASMPGSLLYDEIERDLRQQHGRSFDEVVEPHEIADDRKHLVNGATHEELPALAEELRADVVIMGAVARNRLKRLFIGATAERTLDALPCDLLVIKPEGFKTPVDVENHEEAA